jgi:hypothetical protein
MRNPESCPCLLERFVKLGPTRSSNLWLKVALDALKKCSKSLLIMTAIQFQFKFLFPSIFGDCMSGAKIAFICDSTGFWAQINIEK